MIGGLIGTVDRETQGRLTQDQVREIAQAMENTFNRSVDQIVKR